MRISGHKSRSVFDRYDIVSKSDLEDAALKVERGGKAAARANELSQSQAKVAIAGVAELADAQDLGTKSHALTTNDLQENKAT
jgi:hypothetical protein